MPDEELLHGDQYESLWTEFLASLQTGNDQQQDEQPNSTIATTEEEDNDDDPEFRLADTENEIEDDLDDELHVSSKFCCTFNASSIYYSFLIKGRELALLLEDNASILNNEEFPNR